MLREPNLELLKRSQGLKKSQRTSSFADKLLDFDYITLKGKNTHHPYYNSIFSFWYTIWSYVYKRHVGLKHYYSDDFFMADKIHTILYKKIPLACISSTKFDIRKSSFRCTKFLKNHLTKEVIEYAEHHKYYDVSVLNFLVTRRNLKRKFNLLQTDIATAISVLSIKDFVHSDSQLAITCTRNDVKVNKIALNLGGFLFKETSTNNIKSDIILYKKSDFTCTNLNQSLRDLIDFLWNKKHKPTLIQNMKQKKESRSYEHTL